MKRHVIMSLRSWGEWEKKKKDSKKGSASKKQDKDRDEVRDSLSNGRFFMLEVC